MDPCAMAVSQIIKEQQAIIGPIAIDQARKVVGLDVQNIDSIKIVGDKKEVLANLVNQYAKLFGQMSIEVCKEAFAPFKDKISVQDTPEILKS